MKILRALGAALLVHLLSGVATAEVGPNPYEDEPSGRGIRIAQMLIDEDVDAVFAQEDLEGKGPYYVLTAEHITVLQTDAETLTEALAEEQIEMEVPADGPDAT